MLTVESHITEEQQLWNSFLEGNDASLEKIYRDYFDELYTYGNKWLKNSTLTEDSIQDLFIKLMRNRGKLSASVSIKYYLFRAFRSVALDKLKVKKRMPQIDEPGEHHFLFELCPQQQFIEEEEGIILRKKLSAALQQLTPRQREAIFLRYIEGFSYQEVSDMMDLTPKATYKLMARAIEALKEQMPVLLSLFFLKNMVFPHFF